MASWPSAATRAEVTIPIGHPVSHDERLKVRNYLQRLYPEPVSSREISLRFALSRSQALSVLTALLTAGAVQRLGAGSGSMYAALQGLPVHRRYGARPRRLGFLDELRRRRASIAGEAEHLDAAAGR